MLAILPGEPSDGFVAPEHAFRLVGDPVDVVTGSLHDRLTDARIHGRNPFFLWRRYESHAHRVDRGLGLGHRLELWQEIVRGIDGGRFEDADGQANRFRWLEEDHAVAFANGHTITRVSEDEFVVERRGVPTRVFHRATTRPGRYRLTRIERADGPIVIEYSRDRIARVVTPERVLRFEWDERHLLRVTCTETDAHGRRRDRDLVRYVYDGDLLVEIVDTYKNSAYFDYDHEGRLIRRTDYRGYSLLFDYDSRDRCIRSRGEDGVHEVRFQYLAEARETRLIRPDGATWTYYFVDASKAITCIVDPYGGRREFVVSGEGRIAQDVDPNGNATRFLYGPNGQRTFVVSPLGATSFDPSIAVPEPGDRAPRHPLAWERGESTPPADVPHVTMAPLVPAAVAPWLATTNDTRPPRREIRDLHGNLLRIERREGAPRRYAYDACGNLRWTIDFDGNRTDYAFASWNHLVGVRDALGGVERYEWTPYEKLAAYTDAGATRTEYGYDAKDRLVAVDRLGRTRETYRYDRADNLVEVRDASGEPRLTFEIGPGNKKTKRILASGDVHRFEYDPHGRFLVADSGAGRCEFAYAHRRRIRDERDGRGVRHEVDAADQVTRTTTLGRFVTRYERLADGTRIVVDPTESRHRMRTLGPGVFERALSNGTNEYAQYDHDGRCVAKVAVRGDSPPALGRRYYHSDEGDLLAVDDSRVGRTRFAYDAAHRLRARMCPDGRVDAFEYDLAGNLRLMPGLEASYQAGNRLLYANGDRFEHDDRDHVRARIGRSGEIHYERDSRGQLTRVDGLAAPWEASYDALGRRTRKRFGDAQWAYYWDRDRLAAELRPDGTLRVYVYADEESLVPFVFVDYASADADPSSGRRYFAFADQLGAIDCVQDEAGQVVWSATLDPYGALQLHVGADFDQPLRWPGHYHDAETGLHCNRFRYYSPELGRYLESDPQGLAGGSNLYAYVDRPLTAVDLRGLSDSCPNRRRTDAEADEDGPDAEKAPTARREIPADGMPIEERLAEGGKIPPFAVLEPQNYYFHLLKRAYQAIVGARRNRDNQFPSGYRKATIDAMYVMHSREGRALAKAHRAGGGAFRGEVPIDASGHSIVPAELDIQAQTWFDERGIPIAHSAHDPITFDHIVSCGKMYNDGTRIMRADGSHAVYPPGRNTSRAVRMNFYNEPSNIRPARRSDNSRRGGPTYRQDVGDGYSN